MKVTVLTAVYNTEAYLPECVESVLRQTHGDWQLICVDDASTDRSWEILKDYASRDRRIVLLRNAENEGQAKARNRALALAEGEIVATLDSDDLFAPDALEKVVGMFEKHPLADCVVFRCFMFSSEDLRLFPVPATSDHFSGEEACRLSIDWRIHGVYAARRRLYEQYAFDDSFEAYSDDNTTRLHYLKSREVWLSDAIYWYRQHSRSVTHSGDYRRKLLMLDAQRSLRDALAAEGLPEADMALVEEARWRQVMGFYMHYYARWRKLPESYRRFVEEKIYRYYRDVDTSRLPWRVRLRFGYAPMKWCYPLYRLQMRLFTRLRLLLGMDKGRY